MPKKAVKKAKKGTSKKVVKTKKKAVKVTTKITPEKKKEVGKITHFYGNIGVAVIALTDILNDGDTISIEGATTNFKQKVSSMQLNHKQIMQANKGQEVGIKVKDRVRENDIVYKLG